MTIATPRPHSPRPTSPHGGEFFTAQELAERWGYCPKTITRWIKAGDLSALKIKRQYRIARTEVERFERAHLS